MVSENYNIKTFSDFMDSVTSAKHEHYTEKKGNIVANEVEFNNMKEYLTKLYQGVEVLHSFMDENGSIFDCIPIEHQPSVRDRSEEHTSELQSHSFISYAVFCL